MQFKKLKTINNKNIEGPLLITPKIFEDKRGYFYELWNQSEFNKLIDDEILFLQDNVSLSKKGVVRGLHYQLNPYAQSKLITCRKGAIFDVAVDLRKQSSTFGSYCYAYLNEENKKQFWIPEGFAHGFISLNENTEVQYKVKGMRNISLERSIKWNDPDLDINWPVSEERIIAQTINELKKIKEKRFKLKSYGFQFHSDGAIIMRCIDQDQMLQKIRSKFISKINNLPKKQSNWCHVPIGRILDSIDNYTFRELLEFAKKTQTNMRGETLIENIKLIHEHRWYQTNRSTLGQVNLI